MASRNTDASFSVLGADLLLRGSLHAEADLHIDGMIEGDVVCKSLVQGESSTIKGSISAGTVRLSGTVEGPIEAAQVVILRTATVRGDVRYDALTIEQGAHVEGHFARRDGVASPGLALLG
ncbi:bactofilin family protein [Novosphingobium acidiphilum]|jgi:cytoskeletal protein CcmA (bactofilin family)|uniref:bactofilin family protein n=1 Tax=Novosphingobium acidiphilum TaxID=505248 RepID=UPI0004010411|nr:polymer-forming cytoskeletal protein [Novosphingobium acidiphilum]